MDHDHAAASFISLFVAFGASFWLIFSGEEKPKDEAPQKLTPRQREKLPRSFEALPSASKRFNQD